MTVKIQRTLLAFLLVATLVPIVTFMQGEDTIAHAEDVAETPETIPEVTSSTADGDLLPKQTRPTDESGLAPKEEVVYALLDADGSARAGFIVNHFRFENGGSIEDYGRYSAVQNLSSTAQLKSSGDIVSSDFIDPGDFYYEGTLTSVELPWKIAIAYTLDGKTVSPQQLAGASGRLGIHIATSPSTKADPVFYENYLLQIQLTFSSEKVSALSAPDATVAAAGLNKQVAFMVMPGKEGDLSLEAQVTDFEMPGIQISGLPFSMTFDIPDTSTLTDEAASLADAIAQLNDGVAKLDDGVGEMNAGAKDLASGSAELNSGLAALSRNSSTMTQASQQIDDALALISQQLAAGQVDPAQIEQLIAGLHQLSIGLYSGNPSQPGLYEGLIQMQAGLGSATGTMDVYVAALPTLDPTALGALNVEAATQLSPASQVTLGALMDSYEKSQYVKGVWYGPSGNDGVKVGLDDIAAGLDQSAGSCQYLAAQLSTAADGLESSLGSLAELQALADYLAELSAGYHSFNEGLVGYSQGVDAIAENYASFNYGLALLANSVGDLKTGTAELAGGTNELYVNVEDLPESIQKQVDEFLKDYQKSDFAPTSFASPENGEVGLVQFVLLTDAIEKEKPPAQTDTSAAVEQTFFEKLLALF